MKYIIFDLLYTFMLLCSWYIVDYIDTTYIY